MNTPKTARLEARVDPRVDGENVTYFLSGHVAGVDGKHQIRCICRELNANNAKIKDYPRTFETDETGNFSFHAGPVSAHQNFEFHLASVANAFAPVHIKVKEAKQGSPHPFDSEVVTDLTGTSYQLSQQPAATGEPSAVPDPFSIATATKPVIPEQVQDNLRAAGMMAELGVPPDKVSEPEIPSTFATRKEAEEPEWDEGLTPSRPGAHNPAGEPENTTVDESTQAELKAELAGESVETGDGPAQMVAEAAPLPESKIPTTKVPPRPTTSTPTAAAPAATVPTSRVPPRPAKMAELIVEAPASPVPPRPDPARERAATASMRAQVRTPPPDDDLPDMTAHVEDLVSVPRPDSRPGSRPQPRNQPPKTVRPLGYGTSTASLWNRMISAMKGDDMDGYMKGLLTALVVVLLLIGVGMFMTYNRLGQLIDQRQSSVQNTTVPTPTAPALAEVKTPTGPGVGAAPAETDSGVMGGTTIVMQGNEGASCWFVDNSGKKSSKPAKFFFYKNNWYNVIECEDDNMYLTGQETIPKVGFDLDQTPRLPNAE